MAVCGISFNKFVPTYKAVAQISVARMQRKMIYFMNCPFRKFQEWIAIYLEEFGCSNNFKYETWFIERIIACILQFKINNKAQGLF